MRNHSEAFVAFDTSKLRNAVAIAESGRAGEVRFLGEIDNTPTATAKLVRKLAAKYDRLTFCYEAGPTGYGLHRQITSLGQECVVAAPSLIPKKPGDRVKTNRRDAAASRNCCVRGSSPRYGCRTKITKRCVISRGRARRPCWICAPNASSSRHSCCDRDDAIHRKRRPGPRPT